MDGHSRADDGGQQIGDGYQKACGGQCAERPARGATEALIGMGLGPGRKAALLGRNSAGFAIALAAWLTTAAGLGRRIARSR